ncbi:hypothetical protein GGI43DRAFT_415527 [Trichoderma evansii]
MPVDVSPPELITLWESIPKHLRLSESYTFDALSQSIASLVAKAQQCSQCAHKNELADAFGGIQTANNLLQELLEVTRQQARQSEEGFRGNMPEPFTGDASDYPRWKSDIKNWSIMNEAAPGNSVAAAVLINMSGCAKQWAISKEPRQYSIIDGAPASAAATIKAIFDDMDEVFIDRRRVMEEYLNARQGTRRAFEYNLYYLNTTLDLGWNPDTRTFDYVKSLRDDLRERVLDWQQEKRSEGEPEGTLKDYMRAAARLDAFTPAPQKTRKRKSNQGI